MHQEKDNMEIYFYLTQIYSYVIILLNFYALCAPFNFNLSNFAELLLIIQLVIVAIFILSFIDFFEHCKENFQSFGGTVTINFAKKDNRFFFFSRKI
jgi:hypothetical protein